MKIVDADALRPVKFITPEKLLRGGEVGFAIELATPIAVEIESTPRRVVLELPAGISHVSTSVSNYLVHQIGQARFAAGDSGLNRYVSPPASKSAYPTPTRTPGWSGRFDVNTGGDTSKFPGQA